MALEVREIGIRMQVGEPAGSADAAKSSDSGEKGCGVSLSARERAAVVADCVSAVLAELARRGER
ncbi:DUF5908 family protein [Allosphingosinicella sp.]|uniref:DUF5908 family protein n=1 Tax=Allosphingosinicella sp. TaxID=2823234 RepID=UPI002EDCA578